MAILLRQGFATLICSLLLTVTSLLVVVAAQTADQMLAATRCWQEALTKQLLIEGIMLAAQQELHAGWQQDDFLPLPAFVPCHVRLRRVGNEPAILQLQFPGQEPWRMAVKESGQH
ncbi:hypothetical protein M1466_02595 [Candidatus Dependentiae bacterium]|nr:hypothetical protein [Candidatus Dependentiae bacterium]